MPAVSALNLPVGAAGGLPRGALGTALGYVGMAGRTLFIGTAILVLAFYWTLDGERMLRSGMLRASDMRNAL